MKKLLKYCKKRSLQVVNTMMMTMKMSLMAVMRIVKHMKYMAEVVEKVEVDNKAIIGSLMKVEMRIEMIMMMTMMRKMTLTEITKAVGTYLILNYVQPRDLTNSAITKEAHIRRNARELNQRRETAALINQQGLMMREISDKLSLLLKTISIMRDPNRKRTKMVNMALQSPNPSNSI